MGCLYSTEDAEKLYQTEGESIVTSYAVFNRCPGQRTRNGSRYTMATQQVGVHPGTHFASVEMTSATEAVMHSIAVMPSLSLTVEGLAKWLAEFGNTSLWENLSLDGDGLSIRAGMMAGSLCIAHDGSYMVERSLTTCSALLVIYCQVTRQWLKAAAAEVSDAASNYRGELLGAVMVLLVLCAAGAGIVDAGVIAALHCDNLGVVNHRNRVLMSSTQKQVQADLLRLIKYLVATNPGNARWEWGESHAVEKRGWAGSSLPEQLNDMADKLANEMLVAAIAGGATIEGSEFHSSS